MLTASPTSGVDARSKLDGLLAHFEDGLRDEMFFLGQRDIDSLLEVVHRQGEVLAAILDCTGGRITDPAMRRRWTAILSARDATLRATERLMGAIRSELDDLGRSALRLRGMRRTSRVAGGSPSDRAPVWA